MKIDIGSDLMCCLPKVFLPICTSDNSLWTKEYSDLKQSIDIFLYKNREILDTTHFIPQNYYDYVIILLYLESYKIYVNNIRRTVTLQVNTNKISEMEDALKIHEKVWDIADSFIGAVAGGLSAEAEDYENGYKEEADKKVKAANDEKDRSIKSERNRSIATANALNKILSGAERVYEDTSSLQSKISDGYMNFDDRTNKYNKESLKGYLETIENIRNKMMIILSCSLDKIDKYLEDGHNLIGTRDVNSNDNFDNTQDKMNDSYNTYMKFGEFVELQKDKLMGINAKRVEYSKDLILSAMRTFKSVYMTDAQRSIEKYKLWVGEAGEKMKNTENSLTDIISYINNIEYVLCKCLSEEFGDSDMFLNTSDEPQSDSFGIVLSTLSRYSWVIHELSSVFNKVSISDGCIISDPEKVIDKYILELENRYNVRLSILKSKLTSSRVYVGMVCRYYPINIPDRSDSRYLAEDKEAILKANSIIGCSLNSSFKDPELCLRYAIYCILWMIILSSRLDSGSEKIIQNQCQYLSKLEEYGPIKLMIDSYNGSGEEFDITLSRIARNVVESNLSN